MATKIKYVQLEPAEVLLDFHTSRMTAEQFGCYWLLILHLYCSNGKLEFDINKLGLLCNYSTEFEKVWEKIESKFQKNSGFIKQKRVSKELRAAKERRKAAVSNGLKGARARWHGHNEANGSGIAKESKRNVIEETESKSRIRKDSNSPVQSLVSSNSSRHETNPPSLVVKMLNFNDSLRQIIRPRNQSDRTSFRNIGNWLMIKIRAGTYNEQILTRVLEYAAEAVKGRSRNPAAVFTSILKRELGYQP
jgi:uncharacterized protein YdaU (DUF1376 family)